MGMLEKLFRSPGRWKAGRASGEVPSHAAASEGPRVELDFPRCIAQEYPQWFPAAWTAVEQTLDAVKGADLTPLERRSPGLRGYAWDSYLRCSVVRMVHAARVLHQRGVLAGRLLDYGSYFGNFALMFARLGYQVVAVDSYSYYGAAFAPVTRLLRQSGIEVHDFSDGGFDPHRSGGEALARYDVAVSAGVIEHIPHTPRIFLETLDACLKPSGHLVLDTPNLAYLYNRQRLARGETIFCPIASQYDTEVPFEGHHREYTVDEMRWMLERIGHRDIAIETFNYSLYGAEVLQGADAVNFNQMLKDPSAREVILTVSRKGP